ncbi:fluoride efflux transporter CrcB [Amycolatopsis sp. H20-H5]|uniref:fluoride efflux transporter CrcB n=1 Tax=Amycolatopsis sp. H20-H5 TaxID=3046309 RepID=UPI002DC0027B|nr:fluoride efflux transporter CrcB [Amycolatopsis sp. H20-H5]MEC3981109.1 fluoride efflux transporter CrcB [Amycolatopsis sp. H20-H5]
MTVLLIALGGGAGAVLRYLTDQRLQRAAGTAFPWGTLTVNIAGSLILGLLTGWTLHGTPPGALHTLIGIGFCGGLTTFSTFGYETVRLFTERARLQSVLNVVATVAAGLLAGGAGLLLTSL